MDNYKLYTIRDWERVQPGGVEYSQFFLTEKSGEVRKVNGLVKVLKRRRINGQTVRTPSFRQVHWDGFGRCYVGTHNLRKREYDIPLKAK